MSRRAHSPLTTPIPVVTANPGTHRLGVVINPTSGKGRGAMVGREVVDRLVATGHDVWDLSGNSADLALEHCRRAVKVGLEALIVVGGDGMVHMGVQAVAGTNVPVGIVAVGTGNDFATKLGLPIAEPAAALSLVMEALDAGDKGLLAVDAIAVTGAGLSRRRRSDDESAEPVRWVAGAVSAGLDAAVNERANAMLRPRGSSRYVIAAVRELAAYRAWQYRIEFEHVQGDAAGIAKILELDGFTDQGPEPDGDGRRLIWESDGALVTAANGSTFGGGIPVAPGASVTDGLMNVVLAGDVGKAGTTTLFPALLRGKHFAHPLVREVVARSVNIAPGGTEHLPSAFGDGEHLGTLPLRAELVRGALKVLIPPSS